MAHLVPASKTLAFTSGARCSPSRAGIPQGAPSQNKNKADGPCFADLAITLLIHAAMLSFSLVAVTHNTSSKKVSYLPPHPWWCLQKSPEHHLSHKREEQPHNTSKETQEATLGTGWHASFALPSWVISESSPRFPHPFPVSCPSVQQHPPRRRARWWAKLQKSLPTVAQWWRSPGVAKMGCFNSFAEGRWIGPLLYLNLNEPTCPKLRAIGGSWERSLRPRFAIPVHWQWKNLKGNLQNVKTDILTYLIYSKISTNFNDYH